MCLFITATLSRTADLERIRAIAGPEGSSWYPVSNPYVERQLPSGSAYYRPTGSWCDCASALGRGIAHGGKALRLPKAAARWSQAKRDRWLEQRGAIVEGREAAARGDASAWHAYLGRVVEAAAKPVGLMLHFYRGSVHDEPIDLRIEAPRTIRSTPAAMLQNLEDDVLYVFS